MTPPISNTRWLALALLLAGCGAEAGGAKVEADVGQAAESSTSAPDQEAGAWIAYTVTGYFTADVRDVETILCSETDEGWAIAARGAWTIDLTLEGTGFGERTGRFQVTVPDGTEGAPASVFARRMKGTGTAMLRELGEGAMGLTKMEMEFSATGLQNDDGQTVDLRGKAVCLVL